MGDANTVVVPSAAQSRAVLESGRGQR